MAKNDMPKMTSDHVESLGKVALGMMAVGLTAGLALIAGAKAVGDAIFGEKEEVKEENIPEFEE